MYVIVYNGNKKKVLGYVTLAMAHIRHDAIEKAKSKEIHGNIPALLISHLAVHKDYQRQNLGTLLLDTIFDLALNLQSMAGCRYIILEPRDDQGVRDFYSNYGFEYYPNFKIEEYKEENLKEERDNKVKAFLFDLAKLKEST